MSNTLSMPFWPLINKDNLIQEAEIKLVLPKKKLRKLQNKKKTGVEIDTGFFYP
jgi:hypothetical protein